MLPVVVLSLPFIYMLVRKPVLRRLAIRNASRRPRETMLVILGSLLGTAIITSSGVVGDTLASSVKLGAFTHLGPVDEIVQTTAPGVGPKVQQTIEAIHSPDIDGVLPIVASQAAVVVGEGASRKAEPHAGVFEVDFDRGRQFGGQPDATGLEGPTPTGQNVDITEDLAHTLGVRAGSTVNIAAYGASVAVKVARVLPRKGIAGFGFGFASTAPNVFVPLGTFARVAAAIPPGAPVAPPVTYIAVSNRGDVLGGVKLTPTVRPQLEGAISGKFPATVQPVKQDLLDNADKFGKQQTMLFTSIGFFSVLAGILLLINIFVMLAQERKTEMGMLRAVGLRRASLVGTFSLEGWLYALGASLVGVIAGIGIARVIVLVTQNIFGGSRNRFNGGLELHFRAALGVVQNGFVIGFVIAMVTVVATSMWISRLNVIRAIRDLPDPTGDHEQRRRSQIAGGGGVGVGTLLLASGLAGQAPFTLLLGPAILGLGIVPVLRYAMSRRVLVTTVCGLLIAWEIFAFSLFPRLFQDASIFIFVVEGFVSIIAAVCLISVNQDVIGAVLRRAGGGAKNMSLRLGLAYPLARRFRTALILSMYALVVFIITFVTIFSHLFQGQIKDFTAKVAGGFDLRVQSNPANPVPLGAVTSRPEVEAVSPISTVNAQFKAPTLTHTDEFGFWPGATFDSSYLDRGPNVLHERAAQYPSDRAAYEALLTHPDLIIPSSFFLQRGGGPPRGHLTVGDKITIKSPVTGQQRDLTVAAISESGFGNLYAFISPSTMHDLYGSQLVPDLLYVATKRGVDPDRFATSLNGAYLANGADAISFRSFIQQNLSQQEGFFHLMQGYLALGLVVGIAGLGVVMVRAVRERRRQVGVLRSLGFSAVAVRRAFVAESAFVALEGIVIGVVLASITAWRLVGSGSFGQALNFSLPWLQLFVLVAATAIASLLATATPAQQASRIRPAVALRIAD